MSWKFDPYTGEKLETEWEFDPYTGQPTSNAGDDSALAATAPGRRRNMPPEPPLPRACCQEFKSDGGNGTAGVAIAFFSGLIALFLFGILCVSAMEVMGQWMSAIAPHCQSECATNIAAAPEDMTIVPEDGPVIVPKSSSGSDGDVIVPHGITGSHGDAHDPRNGTGMQFK